MEKIRIGGHVFDYPQNLIVLKADANYTQISYKDGKKLMVATTLGILEKRLQSYRFIRLSRDTLVNFDAVLGYRKVGDSLIATLDTMEEIRISRRRIHHFLSFSA